MDATSAGHIAPTETSFEHHASEVQTSVFAGARPLLAQIETNNNHGNADPWSLAPQEIRILYNEVATANASDVATSTFSTDSATTASAAGAKDLTIRRSELVGEIKKYLTQLLRMRFYPSAPSSPSRLRLPSQERLG